MSAGSPCVALLRAPARTRAIVQSPKSRLGGTGGAADGRCLSRRVAKEGVKKMAAHAAPPSLGRKRPRKQTARPRAALLRCKTYGRRRSCASEFLQCSIPFFGGQPSYWRSKPLPAEFRIEETPRPAHEGGAYPSTGSTSARPQTWASRRTTAVSANAWLNEMGGDFAGLGCAVELLDIGSSARKRISSAASNL